MNEPYNLLLLKLPNSTITFNGYYLKQRMQKDDAEPLQNLHHLIRPHLKIAIVTETWPPEINGVALSLMRLCLGLQQRGHKILLIRPEQKKSCAAFSAYRERLVRAQKIPKYKHLQFGWPQLFKVERAIEDFKPDIVHVVTEGPLGLVAQQTAKLHQIPVSSGFHSSFQGFSRFFDLAYLVKPMRHYLKWFHNNTALTIVPNQATEQALRGFGVTCPLTVVGQGVDIEVFHPQHRKESLRHTWGCMRHTRVMLYVGDLTPEKEVNLLIDAYLAMRNIQGQDVRLVIVGDGAERQHLQALDVDQKVVFTGTLQGELLSLVYASADVFCFASQVEDFEQKILEAMASGLPVIAYDRVCTHLPIQHQEIGWISPLGDVSRFIQYMYQLPSQTRLRYMGNKARIYAEKHAWHYPVQQFEHALYRVAQHILMA